MQSDFKNKAIYTIVILLIGAVFLVITLPHKIILIPPASAPFTSPKEKPDATKTPLVDNPVAEKDNKVQFDYYIIVGTYRNLNLAQQKAGELNNEFNAKIIVLPPTKEGYYRISYGKYSSPEEVKSKIDSVKANISSNAWMFSLKK
jgi:cell division septation protein DedD